MSYVAMKTVVYLDETVKVPYGINQKGWGFMDAVDMTADDFYDYFTMTGTLFDFNGKYVYWIGMDMSGISPILYDAVYRKLCTVTDKLTEDTLIMNGTHTHSGPNVTRGHKRPGEKVDPADIYQEFVEYLAETAKNLYLDLERSLKPFDSEIAVISIDGVYGNRNALDLPADKNVNLIAFKEQGTDKLIGMWMQLTTHSTIIFPKNPKLSSDLVGNVRTKVSEHYGCPVMPFVGCAGDSSTRLTRDRSDDPALDYQELCRLVKEASEQIFAKASFESLVIDRFECTSCELTYAYTQNPESMRRRLVELDKQIEEETNPQQLRLLVQSKESLEKRILGPYDADGKLVGRAYNFGELKFGVAPGELVASLGLRIIKHEPHNHHLVLCYTKDGIGYLVEIAEYGKNFESINSTIPVGLPEVITDMINAKVKEYDY